MAELQNMVLTAGHDLDAVAPPVRVDATVGGERYVQLNGSEAGLEPGDMMMADATGIISSVLRPRPADADRRRHERCSVRRLRAGRRG